MEREAKSIAINYFVIIVLLVVLWLLYTGVKPNVSFPFFSNFSIDFVSIQQPGVKTIRDFCQMN